MEGIKSPEWRTNEELLRKSIRIEEDDDDDPEELLLPPAALSRSRSAKSDRKSRALLVSFILMVIIGLGNKGERESYRSAQLQLS